MKSFPQPAVDVDVGSTDRRPARNVVEFLGFVRLVQASDGQLLARSNSLGAALRSAASSRPGTARSRPGTGGACGLEVEAGDGGELGRVPAREGVEARVAGVGYAPPGDVGVRSVQAGHGDVRRGLGVWRDSLRDPLFWKRTASGDAAGLVDRGTPPTGRFADGVAGSQSARERRG